MQKFSAAIIHHRIRILHVKTAKPQPSKAQMYHKALNFIVMGDRGRTVKITKQAGEQIGETDAETSTVFLIVSIPIHLSSRKYYADKDC
mgnify:CR=1 FL=1